MRLEGRKILPALIGCSKGSDSHLRGTCCSRGDGVEEVRKRRGHRCEGCNHVSAVLQRGGWIAGCARIRARQGKIFRCITENGNLEAPASLTAAVQYAFSAESPIVLGFHAICAQSLGGDACWLVGHSRACSVAGISFCRLSCDC